MTSVEELWPREKFLSIFPRIFKRSIRTPMLIQVRLERSETNLMHAEKWGSV